MASHRVSLRAAPARLIRAGVVAAALITGCARAQAPAALPVNTDDIPIASDAAAESLLVDVKSLAPGIVVAMRYATSDNFTGAPIAGYEANRALLRRDVAAALARVERRAEAEGLRLKIWDAYRPVRATNAMVGWTERVGRQDLIRNGYIASRSRHNLGSTVDLTLTYADSVHELEMGTPFDTFSSDAHTANATGLAAWNRAVLRRLMESEGFSNYDQEWWHYTRLPSQTRCASTSSSGELLRRRIVKQFSARAVRVVGVAGIAMLASAAACARTAPASAPRAAASLAPGAAESKPQLTTSSRHGEWVTVHTPAGDSVRAWIVYPERSTKAPVVLVVHEIFGLSTWIRAVTDQLAADGYIAIAPDLLTGKGTLEGDTLTRDVAVAAIRTLRSDDVQRQLTAVARYAMSLPAAEQRYAVIGFCWGGTTSFEHAVRSPTDLKAAVVYYGTSPDSASLARVQVPVLGLYGGNDARVDATIAPADSVMRELGKVYEHHVFTGAGHGFLRAQDDSANAAAARQAWPLTLAFLRSHLGT